MDFSNKLKAGAPIRPVSIAVTAALSLALLTSACSPEPREPESTQSAWQRRLGDLPLERLNVILITVDTLRADRLSCYGSTRVETPQMDRLAREGIRFTNAASTVPFTLPAHSSIMTGTYPPYHGVRENVGYSLDQDLSTMAELMGTSGRRTAAFVSAFVLDSRWGIGQGFERFFDEFDAEATKTGNLGSVQRDGAETTAEAIRWLDEGTVEPFFLWLHLFDPHDPYTPPEPFKSRYPEDPYDAEVAYADSLIGELRQALEERDLLDRSLLVLTGDHGEGRGQHREGFHGFFVYDSTIRIPLIVRPPFSDLGGRVVTEAVSHVDLLPTILEATGQSLPEHLQGTSLLPLLAGQDERGTAEHLVYSESLYPLLHYGWAPLRTVRSRQYKFIDAPQPELYDVVADPKETTNILLTERRTSRQLKDALEALTARIEEGAREARPADLDEQTLMQLRALGYVAGRGSVAEELDDDRPRADPKDRIELHQLIMAAQSDIGAGELDRAERKLATVLETDDAILDGYHLMGSIASQREDFVAAAEHYRTALEQQSDHPPSLWGLATAYRELGREEEALVGFRRLLDLDPADTKAVLASTDILVAGGARDEAIAILERAAESPRRAPVVLNLLGELLTEEGRSDEAMAHFQEAIEGREDFVAPRFNLAVVYEERGRIEEAMQLYEETLERAPDHYQAMFNLALLAGAKGDTDRQQKLYEAAIAANPDFYRGYYFLAKLIMDRGGDLQRAEELTREALEKDTTHRAGPLGYFVLADILNRQGRQAEARQAVEQGREIQAKGS